MENNHPMSTSQADSATRRLKVDRRPDGSIEIQNCSTSIPVAVMASCRPSTIGAANELVTAVNEREALLAERAALRAVAEAAAIALAVLAKIPAFGDSIGVEVSKPQLGTAHHALKTALAALRKGDKGCQHNSMVATGDKLAWECADCGYVYYQE